MKTTVICLACLVLLTLAESGCYTEPPPAPVAVESPVAAPAPPPDVAVEAPTAPPAPLPPTGYVAYGPEYYTWDGNEYVGVSNGQYVYWTGGAWIVAPPIIVGRFHGWERFHSDWRRHAFRYHRERFR